MLFILYFPENIALKPLYVIVGVIVYTLPRNVFYVLFLFVSRIIFIDDEFFASNPNLNESNIIKINRGYSPKLLNLKLDGL